MHAFPLKNEIFPSKIFKLGHISDERESFKNLITQKSRINLNGKLFYDNKLPTFYEVLFSSLFGFSYFSIFSRKQLIGQVRVVLNVTTL